MKKLILSMFVMAALASCGGADPAKDANDVCDCMIKSNGLKADDPNRATESEKCAKLQMDSWNKYKDDLDNAQKFNEALSECSKKVMEESMKNLGK